MKAGAECYLCLMSQVLRTARVLGLDEGLSQRMAREACAFLAETDFERTPPEISEDLYRLLAELSGNEDPYSEIKKDNIQKALKLYPELKQAVEASADPLRAALEISLAGNVIDFGANAEDDWLSDRRFLSLGSLALDDYVQLVEDLNRATRIVFLGDNAGETVFDRLFIEKIGKKVRYAVREKPIINDATAEEARLSGLPEVAEVISSGCRAPGTVISQCSADFLKILRESELIIAKGQGNFECLEQIPGPFYFLLKAKCEVVSRHLGVEKGSLVLTRSRNFQARLAFNI